MRLIDADALELKQKIIYMEFDNVAVPTKVITMSDLYFAPTIDADTYFDAVDRIRPCPKCRYQIFGSEFSTAGLEQVRQERDALMEELRGRCFACVHVKQHDSFPQFNTCAHVVNGLAFLGDGKRECAHWEWRGVQE